VVARPERAVRRHEEVGMGDGGREVLEGLVGPALTALGLELVDVEVASHRVLVTVDRPEGVDLDVLARANQAISAVLDEWPELTPRGPYGLEVSSPGLERPLRRPLHFQRAVGCRIAVKTRPGAALPRRLEGLLLAADEAGIEVRLLGGADAVDTPDDAVDTPRDAVDGPPDSVVGPPDSVAGPVARLSYEQISSARTVFEWASPGAGRPPAPDAPKRQRSQARKVARA
jgi:ribosome maturation factor RimP